MPEMPRASETARRLHDGLHHDGREDVDAHADHGAVELRRRHANHGERLTVDENRRADDARIGGERASPERIADHRHRMPAGRDVIGRHQRPPELRTDPERAEVIAGDELGDDELRVDASPEAGEHHPRGSEVDERLIASLDVPVVGHRQAELPALRRLAQRHGEPAGSLDTRERLERESLEEAEDRGVAGDAERQHENHHEREPAVFDEHPDAEPHVLPDVDDGRDRAAAPHLPRGLGGLQRVAELLDRREPGGLGVFAAGDPVRDRHLEVVANLGVEIALDGPPPKQPRQDVHVSSGCAWDGGSCRWRRPAATSGRAPAPAASCPWG